MVLPVEAHLNGCGLLAVGHLDRGDLGERISRQGREHLGMDAVRRHPGRSESFAHGVHERLRATHVRVMRVVRREQCRELTHDGPALHGFEPVQDGECAGMAFGELAQLSSEDDGRLVAIGVEDDDVAVARSECDLRIDITG